MIEGNINRLSPEELEALDARKVQRRHPLTVSGLEAALLRAQAAHARELGHDHGDWARFYAQFLYDELHPTAQQIDVVLQEA